MMLLSSITSATMKGKNLSSRVGTTAEWIFLWNASQIIVSNSKGCRWWLLTTSKSRQLKISILLAIFLVALTPYGVIPTQAEANGTGIKPHMYMAFLIQETLANKTKVQAIDSYYILNVSSDGSFDAEIKWGVVGFETQPLYVPDLTPIDPSDPNLRSLPVIVDLNVQDGFYKFGGATNKVERDSLVYNGIAFAVISSNETIRNRLYPRVILYRGLYYYEEKTGILLHSSYVYGPPTFSVGTIDLVATNAFPLNARNGNESASSLLLYVPLVLLGFLSFPLTRSIALIRARRSCERRTKGFLKRKRGERVFRPPY